MCTLTWRYDELGYTVVFSRDERRTRAAAAAPVARQSAGVAYLAPTDGDASGTWIATNDRGVTLCLLNGYGGEDEGATNEWRSRGLVVLELAASHAAAAAIRRFDALDLARVRPFVLAAFDDGGGPAVVEWDGRRRRSAGRPAEPPIVSSSFDPNAVRAARAELFGRTAGRDGALERYHASHEPEPGPFSVCMHRDDAATVSLSVVRVEADAATFRYRAGAPCDGTAVESVSTLERRRGPSC